MKQINETIFKQIVDELITNDGLIENDIKFIDKHEDVYHIGTYTKDADPVEIFINFYTYVLIHLYKLDYDTTTFVIELSYRISPEGRPSVNCYFNPIEQYLAEHPSVNISDFKDCFGFISLSDAKRSVLLGAKKHLLVGQ